MASTESGLVFRPRRESRPASVKTDSAHIPRTWDSTSPIPEEFTISDEEGPRQYVPPVEVSADVTVTNGTSRTVLTQIFLNETDLLIEQVSYCFPLYHHSAIISFCCWHGAEIIRGVLRPKEAARGEFKKALDDKKLAALVEKHTSEIFETAIGNIRPGQQVKVEIQYITELKADVGGEGLVLTIPCSIAPRYGTPPEGYARGLAQNRAQLERGMVLQIGVSMPVRIKALESRTHPIKVTPGVSGPCKDVSTKNFRDLA